MVMTCGNHDDIWNYDDIWKAEPASRSKDKSTGNLYSCCSFLPPSFLEVSSLNFTIIFRFILHFISTRFRTALAAYLPIRSPPYRHPKLTLL